MFFLVLLFLIFGSFFAFLRFPNLISRLRLPRFNLANGFRNPKIKTLLNDRYFFYQNADRISKGSLFVVIGKNTCHLYESLLQAGYEQKNNCSEQNSWTERGQTEAFAILTVQNANYLFVHPALMNKNVGENFNSRTQFLIDRLCALRKRNVIDGIIFATHHTNPSPKARQTLGLSEEVLYCSYVFELFAKKIKIHLPIFYIEHKFLDSTAENRNENYDSSVNYKTDDIIFSFSCDFAQKPSSQKHEDFLTESFSTFSNHFNINFHHEIINNHASSHEFESIASMYSVKVVDAMILKSVIIPFLKNYIETGECAPASIYILNSSLFPGENLNDRLSSVFLYLSAHGIEKFVIPQELLDNKFRKNLLLFTTASCLLLLFSFSLIRSEHFLSEKRLKFIKTIENFQTLDNSMKFLLDKNDDLNSLAELQETSCLIIKNYSEIKDISFRSVFLFPSWNSKISEQVQKKYKDKFSLVFSNFLFQKYSISLNNFFDLKDFPSTNAHASEILNYINKYVKYLADYKDIYNLLDSNDSKKINKALILISKNIYENKCVEDEKSFDFLTKIDPIKFHELIRSTTDVQKQASKTLLDMMNKYFSAVLINNTLMNSALNLNHDLKEFDHIVEAFEERMNITDDNDISGVRSAFIKSLDDYKLLMENFPDQKPLMLSSPNDFFGPDFIVLLDGIKKNQLFDSVSFSEINASSRTTFESFKQKLDVSSLLNEKNNFSILKFDEKSNLYLNPKVVILFSALEKFNNTSNISPSIKTSYSDLHHVASSPAANVVWVDRKLQIALQKYKDLQSQSSLFELDEYPEVFSEYLQDYISNYFEKYWSSSLIMAMNITDNNNLTSNELGNDDLDPHGIISSASSLKQIVQYLISEHFDDVLSDFDEIYLRQVNDVLKQKTILFDKKELFGENADFKLWDGSTSLAYDLFYASSDETLTENLEKQKQILFNFYNQYVEASIKSIIPIMQLRTNLRSPYYNRWYSIYLAVEDKNKSYQNFTAFIFGDLKKFRLDDCPKILENVRDSTLISDYFDSRIEYLYGKINERCRVIYMNTAINGYEEFAQIFNELLAGKYPFSKLQTIGQNQINVDTQDLQRVLLQFQAFSKEKYSFLLKYNQKFSDRADIINFISQMSKVNMFFQNSLIKSNTDSKNADENSTNLPKLNGYFVFRSHKNEENLANHIIDWELGIGDKHYGSSYGNLQNTHFNIDYGQSFNFSMKFADTLHPQQIGISDKNTMKVVRSGTMSLTYKQPWALIRFLDEYKTCADGDGLCAKEKLKFQIPLEDGQNVVVFCDLILTDQFGNKIPLPSFPYRAPSFRDKLDNGGDRVVFSSSNF